MPNLETERLHLIPFSLEYVIAAMRGREELEALLLHNVSKQWPNTDFAQILPMLADELEKEPSKAIWNGLMIQKDEKTVIGDMGCKGGPDRNGVVDIGYGVVPEYRGQGYASEMAKALVVWLLSRKDVTKITANCFEDNIGSIRVLEKVGFTRLSESNGLLYWEFEK
ncbi:GNAT family N-acetyltransferase [Peribacillus tepidiphilus]|jgi:[ribosomal protein S5]-alanine N-acetyltransferase|uniref:GNAT family N-acetyltransferase n=1 Tax=Peribacillus tepidiphilus TaxID=2652445 RepID=UPI0035B501AD